MKPTDRLDIEAYCDSDFAGLYGSEPHEDPASAMSHMGWIIKLGGCPIVWKSQLIPEITLSTAESEYASLSACMRVLIPFCHLLLDVAAGLGLPEQMTTSISSRVFEDNNAALQLVTNQCITSRTHHYLVKWHHFWTSTKSPEHGKEPDIEFIRVASELQDADYLTKGLVHVLFEANRLQFQGW